MTAETESNRAELASSTPPDTSIPRLHLIVAAFFLVIGSLVAVVASLQLVLPDLLSGIAVTTFGRLAPAARILLADGWLTLGLLGASYAALTRVTGSNVRRSGVALASLVVISLGVLAAVIGILLGYQSGIVGQDAPVWGRIVLVLGYALAAVAVIGTARTAKDSLGATGWYLTAAPVWLTLSGIVSIIPMPDGIPGSIQAAFANAGVTGLFFVTASVGLLYFVFTSITDTDPSQARPLATLGFWSLTLVWANLAAVPLIYGPTPDWYETLSVAFAICSLIPLLVIATDLGLILRGETSKIADRGSLRYGVIAGMALAAATVVLLVHAWRASSAIVQFTTWVNAFETLIVLGGGSYAVFAAASVLRGGRVGRASAHTILSTAGLAVITVGLLVGGGIVGFSWAAGPVSQSYADTGDAWKITIDSATPFLWIAAVGMIVFAAAQIVYVVTVGRGQTAPVADIEPESVYDLEFEGPPRYATWRRFVVGVIGLWVFAAVMMWLLPVLDGTDRDATLLAEQTRTYAAGSEAATGRDLYVSEGCTQCHTQLVRPVGTDVGLGPVSIAGDYAHEQPALLGSNRFGPDLMHFASSVEFLDQVILRAKLDDPRAVVPWSTMPSYSYLSESELAALISYVETLR